LDLSSAEFPPSRKYGHEQTWHDGNGHSHLQATLLGPSLIFHLECDVRGRERTIVVPVIDDERQSIRN
jgi:hypothetical protein